MNAHLLAAALAPTFAPTVAPASPLAASPWSGGGAEAASGGGAFSRLLNDARQGPGATAEPPRPSNAEAESASRRGEPGEAAQAAARENRTDRSGQTERPASPDRPESGDGDAAGEPTSTSTGVRAEAGRRAGGPGTSNSSSSQAAAARREGAAASTRATRGAGGAAGAPDAEGAEGTPGTEGDDAATALGRGRRAGAEAADPLAGAAAMEASTHARSQPAGEAAAGVSGQAASAARATAATEAAGDDLHALLQAAARGAGTAAAGSPADSSTGARGAAVSRRNANDSGGADANLDPRATSTQSLRAAASDGAVALAAADAGRTFDGVLADATSHLVHLPSGAVGGAAGTGAAAGPAGTTSLMREAGLATPPGSEGFARELGAQVTLFVREGVQQARLHLNPQELGPVLVRIQLEGQAAQVHLAAELAPTRQALEQALPSLASQLSEAGLTLTGGGVFGQPPQGFTEREAAGAEDRRALHRTDGPAESAPQDAGMAAATGRWSAPRGLVDLVA